VQCTGPITRPLPIGIVGGEPKVGKSFLALDMVVAVAARVPCLRNFAPARRGPVLLYAAEDALYLVRTRLEGICRLPAGVYELTAYFWSNRTEQFEDARTVTISVR
jgi:AAA domain-containing protein